MRELLCLLCLLLSPMTQAWGYSYHQRTFPLADALPDPRMTPGAIDPRVTPYSLHETICRRGGYTASVRPPERYTERLKWHQVLAYYGRRYRLGEFEEDHLISLELGGSPTSPLNLWPEPHDVQGGWGSYAKDRLEGRLHRLVCDGVLGLRQAQHAIATNWIQAYKRYVGPVPNPRPLRWQRHEERHRHYW
ncbi:MAG: hypothetical protein M0T84_07800 [Betaproteobacteria bacterium]|nr:hypothetical protein [Betaproteobacteria bacterium]